MLRPCLRIIIIALTAVIFYGCSTASESVKDTGEIPVPEIPALKVGITPYYPPIIFKQAGEIVKAGYPNYPRITDKQVVGVKGVEADLAKLLAEELGRPLEFIELPWKEQIPALLAGKTDIIMSGMSATKARGARIRFTEPYLESGLLGAFRTEDKARYTSIESILNTDKTVGVVKGTTAAAFAKKNFPNAERIFELSRAKDGGTELKRYVIDLFIHDAPSIIWIVSESEGNLSGVWELLNDEQLAWGITGEDPTFEMDVNNILKKYKEDGTLSAILKRWLPYQELLKK